MFNSSLSNESSNSIDNKPKPIPNLLEKDHKDLNQFDNIDANEALEILGGNKLDIANTKQNKHNNIDDPLLEEMQCQSQTN